MVAHMRLFQIIKTSLARVTDPEKENDNISTAEETEVINEVSKEEDTASEENPPAIKSDDHYTLSDEDTSQLVEDNEAMKTQKVKYHLE